MPARDETWRHSHRIERNTVRRQKLEPNSRGDRLDGLHLVARNGAWWIPSIIDEWVDDRLARTCS